LRSWERPEEVEEKEAREEEEEGERGSAALREGWQSGFPTAAARSVTIYQAFIAATPP
jgi:hypothetical protein